MKLIDENEIGYFVINRLTKREARLGPAQGSFLCYIIKIKTYIKGWKGVG
jgi:hypothetical protein